MKVGYSFDSLAAYLESVDANAVKITGTQTIGGAKTFSTNPLSTAAQNTAANALVRYDTLANYVKRAGDTMTGRLTVSVNGDPILLVAAAGQGSSIMSQVGGVNNWYVGKGGAGDDILLRSYIHNTYISLQAAKVVANKDLYVNSSKVFHQGFIPTAANVGALPITGGTLTGPLSINPAVGTNHIELLGSGSPSGSNARGVTFKDAAGGAVEAGLGIYTNNGVSQFSYIGFGTNPWVDGIQIRSALDIRAGGTNRIYHQGFKPTASELGVVAKTGDTMTGRLTVSVNGDPIYLVAAAGQGSSIMSQVGGVNNWYVGKGGAGDDILLRSYIHNTYISLQAAKVVSSKDLYVGSNKVYHQGFKPTAADVGLTTMSQAATAYTLAQRDASGDIAARLLKTSYADEAAISGAIAFRKNNSSDSFIRYCNNPSAIRTWLGALATTGNAASASKWATARTLTLSGDATGSATFDGSANISLAVTVANNSHSLTAALGNSDIVASGYGQVGTYGLMRLKSATGDTAPGSTMAGSNLYWASAQGSHSGVSPAGTWKCLGFTDDSQDDDITLWIRIA